MAIAFRSAGTFGTTPGIPAGIQSGDILVLVVNGAIAAPSGWTAKISASGLSVHWKRTTGTEAAPALSSFAQIAAFSGCVSTGDPFEAASAVATGSTSATAASITTLSANAMTLFASMATATDYDTYEAYVSIADPSTGPARSRAFASARNGDTSYEDARFVGLRYGIQASAGATGTETSADTLSGVDGTSAAAALLALKPTSGPSGYDELRTDTAQATTSVSDSVLSPGDAADRSVHARVGSIYVNVSGTGGATVTLPGSPWAPNTEYTRNTCRTNGGRIYQCTTAGTSAASGGPSGTTADIDTITDNTAKWKYVCEEFDFDPKAFIFLAPHVTSEGATAGLQFGVSDGTNNAAVASVNSASASYSSSCIGGMLASGSASFLGTCTRQTRGFKITFTSTASASSLINFMALGGVELQAKAGYITAATGASDIVTGFNPSAIIAFSTLGALSTNGVISVGCAAQAMSRLSGVEQSSIASRVAGTVKTNGIRDSAILCAATPYTPASVPDASLSVSSFGSDRISVNNVSGSPLSFGYLALAGAAVGGVASGAGPAAGGELVAITSPSLNTTLRAAMFLAAPKALMNGGNAYSAIAASVTDGSRTRGCYGLYGVTGSYILADGLAVATTGFGDVEFSGWHAGYGARLAGSSGTYPPNTGYGIAALLIGDQALPPNDSARATDSVTDRVVVFGSDPAFATDAATEHVGALENRTTPATATTGVSDIQAPARVLHVRDVEYTTANITANYKFPRSNFVHGSAYVDGWIYGVVRDTDPNAFPQYDGIFLKIDSNLTPASYQTGKILNAGGTNYLYGCAAIGVGPSDELFTMGYDKDTQRGVLIELNKSDLNASVRRFTTDTTEPLAGGGIGYNAFGQVVLVDATHVYYTDSSGGETHIVKVARSDWTISAKTLLMDVTYQGGGFVHTGEMDSQNIYLSTQSTGAAKYTLPHVYVVRKSDLALVDTKEFVSVTDDSCVTSSHYVASPEISTTQNAYPAIGKNFGLAAYNINTGRVTVLGSLDPDMDAEIAKQNYDAPATPRSAVSSFGVQRVKNYLVDLKHTTAFYSGTSNAEWQRAYIVRLDPDFIDAWSDRSEITYPYCPPGPMGVAQEAVIAPNPVRHKLIRRIVRFPFDQWPTGHGPVNETLIDANNVDVYLFTWGGPGATGIVKVSALVPDDFEDALTDSASTSDAVTDFISKTYTDRPADSAATSDAESDGYAFGERRSDSARAVDAATDGYSANETLPQVFTEARADDASATDTAVEWIEAGPVREHVEDSAGASDEAADSFEHPPRTFTENVSDAAAAQTIVARTANVASVVSGRITAVRSNRLTATRGMRLIARR